MPLVTTPGAADADSYASFDEYTAYWTARGFNTAQLAAQQADVENLMRWATRLMDSIFTWTGSAVNSVQALAWPRSGMLTPNGFVIGTTTIPVQLKNAECEFAGILISGDRTADDPSLKVIGSETMLDSVKAGPVMLKFGGGNFTTREAFEAFVRSLGSDLAYLSKAMPDSVRQLIPPSWYVQATLKRKIIFGAAGGSTC